MDTGVGIPNPLFFIGVVENNVDERLEGRVQVRAFGVHGSNKQVPSDDLPWATIIHGSYDPNDPLPPINSFVFGFFLDGRDAQQPMILGLIPTQMTEILDPEISGWGRITDADGRILARGSTPSDLGQPQNSRLARGEQIEQTYVARMAMNRTDLIEIASHDPDDDDARQFFGEPAPAYDTEYPYNRVIETANHSVELDDTPGSERITIFHGEGSYISIDSRGTSTYKSVSDKFDINDRNKYIHVKGEYCITVEGDCRVLVKGNKIEEITGDLIQNVRGNHYLSVGAQSTINASDEVQIRGAKLRFNANVEGINLSSAKKIRLQSGELMSLKSAQEIRLDAADPIGIKSGIGIAMSAEGAIDINAQDGNLNMQSSDEVNLRSATMYLNADGALDLKGGHVKAGGGTKVSIDAQVVAIDDIVQLANNQAMAPQGAGDAGAAEAGEEAEAVEAPEPVAKSVSTTRRARGTTGGPMGSAGYTTRDDRSPAGSGNVTVAPDAAPRSTSPGININDPAVQARLEELRNDPEFMREFNATLERFPNLTADELWGTIAGESGGNPSLVNTDSNGLYGGLFQLGQTSVGLDPNVVASKSPTEQMRLYRGYLESINYVKGPLGMYQAAPGVVSDYIRINGGQLPPNNLLLYIPRQYTDEQIRALQDAGYITNYASRHFDNRILSQNSAGDKTTITPGTGWVEATPQLRDQGIPGVISVGQTNRFYSERG